MKNFNTKVVAITGAGSGIGRALALAFAKENAYLALNDFNVKTLRETVELLKPFQTKVFEKAFDVSNREAMFSFADEVMINFRQVDVMINNAGIGLGEYPFHEVDLDMFEKVMNINFNGVLYGSRAFIPHLLKQTEAALVNVSSIFGLTGIAFSSAYCASKFAVHGLNQCLMQEYLNTNLFIHSVHPGGVNTNISENSIDYKADQSHDDFKKQFLKISPDEAAKTIINGIKKKKRKILIGAEAYQLDIAVRLFPYLAGRLVNNIIQKKMEAAKKN